MVLELFGCSLLSGISVFVAVFSSCGSSSSAILPVISEWGGKVVWSRHSPVSCGQALSLQDVRGRSIMGSSSVRLF